MLTVKDVIGLASDLIGLDDVSAELQNYENAIANDENFEFTSAVKKKIDRLIKCVGLTVDRIASNYLSVNRSEELVSDFQGKISYDDFSASVIEIIAVSDASSGAEIPFNSLPYHLYLPYKNRRVLVDYRFSPRPLKSVDEEIVLPPIVSKRVIALGVVSDYLLSKNVYDEAKYWNEKFEENLISQITRRQKLYLAPRKFM